jgi:hypothetical protein
MYAFKKSGVYGDYDVVDELDMYAYVESLPVVHEPVENVEDFKKVSAQYFTPSNLKQGMTRSAQNIADVQGIIFDLDDVDDWNELKNKFYQLLISVPIEAYLWKTPAGLFNGDHKNGTRLYIPLREGIHPQLLPEAVRELFMALAQSGINLLDYGADMEASRTVGRLMGLPLQKQDTLVPWDPENRVRYKVQAKYVPTGFKAIDMSNESGFVEINQADEQSLTGFITSYTQKHGITWQRGERDNNLTKVIGAVDKAFSSVDENDLLRAFYNSGVAQQLDNPERDILNKTKRLLKG